jgi:hypothetical protein
MNGEDLVLLEHLMVVKINLDKLKIEKFINYVFINLVIYVYSTITFIIKQCRER